MTNTAGEVEPIRIQFSLTFKEYFRFVLWTAFRRMKLLSVLAVMALGIFLASPRIPWGTDEVVGYERAAPTLLIPAIIAAAPLSNYIIARKRWKSVAHLRESKAYLFSDDVVRIDGATFHGTVDWSHILSANQAGPNVCLGIGQNAYHLIPRRAFLSGADYERFRALVSRKVATSKLPDK